MAKIEQHYICDKCKQPIIYPEEGRTFVGNVLMADPNGEFGLIGDNFPEAKEGAKTPLKFTISEVNTSVLCNKCVIEALQLGDYIKQRYEVGQKPNRLLPVSKSPTQAIASPQNIPLPPGGAK